MRRSGRLLCSLLVLLVALAPGCVIGSPLAAFSGEPYGMVIDDVRALQGRNGRIWSQAPAFAVIDIPFAFVLDTGLLPISAIMWLILHAGESDDDDDDEPAEEAPADEAADDSSEELTPAERRRRERLGRE